ncbi:uncharacterized protein LOC111629233 [Centruroides sculpturatus]|uniref:uncharacterized protein LOC111629233 n=1 Tax=Centruroides sculpturatus TaxID=218467 RepID=UPI000C6D92F8|nr:uncharacterized protein LOC111629233 [Centruroides sculpturatus]
MIKILEDHEFLLAQREKGPKGSMVGVNAKLAAKEKRSARRQEQMINRKRGMEDLKRSGEEIAELISSSSSGDTEEDASCKGDRVTSERAVGSRLTRQQKRDTLCLYQKVALNRLLKKNKGRQSVTQQTNEAEFVSKLDEFFGISHLRAVEMIKILEDHEFLLAQREKGPKGSMVGVNAKLAAKEKRSARRQEQMINRKRGMEDLKRSGEEIAELISSSSSGDTEEDASCKGDRVTSERAVGSRLTRQQKRDTLCLYQKVALNSLPDYLICLQLSKKGNKSGLPKQVLRLYNKAETFLCEEQFGFRKGKGTRDAIGLLRTICERNICFIDMEKAFDMVNWTKLMEILRKIGTDWKDRRLIASLYMNQSAIIRTKTGESKPCSIGKGELMNEAISEDSLGIKIGGQLIQSIRFADDIALLAPNEQTLQCLVTKLNKTCKKFRMKVNTAKSKVMKVGRLISKDLKILIDENKIEQVQHFRYLDSINQGDGRCEKEIKERIRAGKMAFYN